MSVESRGTEYWVKKMGAIDMPVLGTVLQELNDLTGRDDTEINQLAAVILKDPNLTSQVLRIANSVTYNPSSYPINTVSRAIVLIGFQGVKAICVSVMVVDSLLGASPRDKLKRQMADSFHCAAQAKQLLKGRREHTREEVFVAGLLLHLSELVFWSSGGAKADQLESELTTEKSNRQAVEAVLGCSFKSVTRGLADLWNLGETLSQAVSQYADVSPKAAAVRLADDISQAAKLGWDTDAMNDAVRRAAKFTGLSLEAVREGIEQAADEAVQVAETYGGERLQHLIPLSRQSRADTDSEIVSPSNTIEIDDRVLQGDARVQLNVLRDLSNAVKDRCDINAIFQMLIEGLHRGVGLERVVIGLVIKNQISAKYLLGANTDGWRRDFRFTCAESETNLFAEAARESQPLWLTRQVISQKTSVFTPAMKKVLGGLPCLVGGLFLRHRCVAMVYADRGVANNELDQEHFQSFSLLIAQAESALRLLSDRRAKD